MADNSTMKTVDLGKFDLSSEGDNKPKGDDAQESNFDVSSFFEELDRQVNGAVLESNVEPNKSTQKKESGKSQNSGTGDNAEVHDPAKELETLKKRYSDSSAEAKRLHDKLKSIESYEPIIELLRSDPNFANVVSGYLDKRIQSPDDTFAALDLPEDFMYDAEEAIRNPNSESARVFQAAVDRMVQKRIAEREAIAQRSQSESQMIQELQSKYELSGDEVNELMEFAKQKTLTLEDIYFLKNRENIPAKVQQQAAKERQEQMKKMRQNPGSLATLSADSNADTEEADLFSAILKASSGQTYF